MTPRNARRVQLTPGYILHHRPYRDTSRILEVISREYGRISVFARGVRGPKAKLASILQPFQMLLLSWTSRGEAAQLTGAESAQAAPPVPPSCLMAAFYLNELLLKLTTRHDPLPVLFDTYHATLDRLRHGAALEPELRVFEKRLLEAVGYGLDLGSEAQTGKRIEPHEYYHFRPEQGLVATIADARELEDSKRLLQAALAQCLEGRPLATRGVAKSVARREIPAPARDLGT